MVKTYSIGTISLTMMLAMGMIPPAPSPQTALAMMNSSMLLANAHHSVANAKTTCTATNSHFLPSASESRPNRGWKAVDVSRNAVDSQDASYDAPKYDVITGCDDAIMVRSKQAIKHEPKMTPNMSRKRTAVMPERNGVGVGADVDVLARPPSNGDASSAAASAGMVACAAVSVGASPGALATT